MKISEFRAQVNEWLLFVGRSHSASTLRVYRSCVKQLLKFIAANETTTDVEFCADTVEKFLDSKLTRQRSHNSRQTYNTYLIILRGFASWRQKKHGTPSPVHDIPFLRPDPPRQRALTQDEVDLYKNILKGMDRDILLFLCNTGLRKTEFRNLRWRDIDTNMTYVAVSGKGRKRRIVPLNNVCREVLSRYKRYDEEYLQISQQYPSVEGPSWLLKRYARKLKIPDAGCHAARHYFATQMIRRGVSIYKLSKILGHSSVTTTERIYVRLAPVDLLGVTDVLC